MSFEQDVQKRVTEKLAMSQLSALGESIRPAAYRALGFPSGMGYGALAGLGLGLGPGAALAVPGVLGGIAGSKLFGAAGSALADQNLKALAAQAGAEAAAPAIAAQMAPMAESAVASGVSKTVGNQLDDLIAYLSSGGGQAISKIKTLMGR